MVVYPTLGSMAFPPGVVPNYENPESRAGQLLAANIVCLIIAAAFVSMRIYTQIFLLRAVWWDDFVCVLAFILSIVFSICNMILCNKGLGTHLWDIPFEKFSPDWLKMNVVVTSIYPILIILVKFAILLLYVRVLGTCSRTFYGSIILMAVTFAYNIAGFFAIVFACTPRRKIWDVMLPYGRCINIQAVTIASAALNAVTDILILLLPMPLVWYFLSIPRRQKLALTAVFMTGSFVCIVSLIRLQQVVESFKTFDLTWSELDSMVWSVVEVNVGIACACMPKLKVLVRKLFPRLLETYGAASGEGASHTATLSFRKSVATATATSNAPSSALRHGAQPLSGSDGREDIEFQSVIREAQMNRRDKETLRSPTRYELNVSPFR